MSDVENPWQSPQSASVPQQSTQGALTDTMLRYLVQAAPWLQFIGVLGFIGCGFSALAVIVMAFAISSVSSVWGELLSEIPGIGSSGIGAGLGVFTLVFSLALVVLWFFPSLFIYNFGGKIRSYQHSGAEQELEAAFRNNKSLWKFFGVLAIVCLAFVPVTIVGSIIAVVAAAIGG